MLYKQKVIRLKLQVERLRDTVKHCMNNPVYRERLEKAGVTPESITSVADIRRIPFTTKQDLRYVLYMYMTALDDPTRVIASPAGAFMVPEGEERIGDVSNVLFTNGWIADEDGKVFIYYASSDTRMHVATSTIDRLVDYCFNTPEDGLFTAASVETIKKLVAKNRNL